MGPDLTQEPDAEMSDLPPTDTHPEDGSEPSMRVPSVIPEDQEWVPDLVPDGLDEDVEAGPIDPDDVDGVPEPDMSQVFLDEQGEPDGNQ